MRDPLPAAAARVRAPRRWRRIVLASLLALALLLVATLVAAVWLVRRPFPQVEGTLAVAGLDGPVDVHRDELGVPTIVATTTLDLYRAQGFVHAQDRFWQMDVFRHIGRGRTGEMFGAEALANDRFLRTLGWEDVAEQELELVEPETREILEAYASGVNAYLASRPPGRLSLEYTLLGVQNPAYEPAPWEPVDSLVFMKLMAWDLRSNMDDEIERAVLEARLGERAAQLFPGYADAPVIVPDPDVSTATGTRGGERETAAATAAATAEATEALEVLAERFAAVDALTGRAGEGMGSNSWVVAGEHTADGSAILANDPHLGIQMPSIWYQVALRCAPDAVDCEGDARGFSFASLPGVVIGHNDRIAWGFTNLGADVMDLHLVRVNPDDPHEYLLDGEWVAMDVSEEVLRGTDGRVETLEVRRTRFGPIVSDTHGAAGALLDEDVPGAPAGGAPYALALRWTALDPGRTIDTLPALNRARDWEDFRAAAALFEVPAQNLVYADVDGNIGYQAPGRIPIRAAGDGRLPAPGWSTGHEWSGFVPFEELPYEYNPERGWIVTANNPVVDDDYPHLLGSDWDHGFRAARIETLLADADALTLDDAHAMQLDTRDPGAAWLTPALLAVDVHAHGLDADDRERVETAQDLLEAWDGHTDHDDPGAAVYQAAWRHLLARTFHPHLPERYHPAGGARWIEVVRRLLERPESAWWDDPERDGVQRRDDVLAAALRDAVVELTERLGGRPEDWSWGDLHTATFRNGTLGESGIGVVEARFNRGPYPVGGSAAVVNAVGWHPADGYEVNWLPSFRMVLDLGDLDAGRLMHTTGQSGHAYHRDYTSMVPYWREGRVHEPGWDLDVVARRARDRLRLEPTQP